MAARRNDKKIVYRNVLLAAVSFVPCAMATAHHSHAMFDHTRTVTISGVVSNVSYRNPHVFLWVDAEDEDGRVQSWSVEMSNIQNMIRRGIGASTFEVGDHVTVTMNPLSNGKLGGNYVTITDADGKVYD